MELQDLTTKSDISVDNQKKNIENLISSEEQKRERITVDADKKIEDYKNSLSIGASSLNNEINSKVKNFRNENDNLEKSISKLENDITKLNKELSAKLKEIDAEQRAEINKLNILEIEEIKEIEKNNNVFTIGNKISLARDSFENKRQNIILSINDRKNTTKNIFQPSIDSKQKTIAKKNQSIKQNDDEINKLLKTVIEVKTPNQDKIDSINNKRVFDLKKIDKNIDQYQIKLNKLIESTLGVNNKRVLELNAEIKLIDQEI